MKKYFQFSIRETRKRSASSIWASSISRAGMENPSSRGAKVFIAKVHFNPKGNSDNSQWVRKTHPEFERLNDEIKKKYDEVLPAKKVLGGKAKRDSLAVAL